MSAGRLSFSSFSGSEPLARPITRVRAHGMEWLTVQEFAAAIPRLDIVRSRHPESLGEDELVKDSMARTVMRLPDPDAPERPGLYLKRYKLRTFRERVKHLLVPAKPVTEWRVCRALQAVGIPTCDVLAVAVRRRRGLPREGFLVSREIPGAVDLRQLLEVWLPAIEKEQPGFGREVIEELAKLTARLADGGFEHRDYHRGNLLIRLDAPAGQRLYVLDLHRIRRGRVGRRAMARMLAALAGSSLRPPLLNEYAYAFLSAVLRDWQGGRAPSREETMRLRDDASRKQRKLWRRRMKSRTRRCLVESTMFTRERADGYVIHRRRDFPVDAALRAIDAHRSAIAGDDGAGHVFRKGRRTEVTVCPCDSVPPFDVSRPAGPEEVKPGEVCVKAFRRDSVWGRLKDLLRPRSRARSAWVAARGFAVRGVPAARPLALLESRSKLSGRPDYLITEALENDGDLGELALSGRLPTGKKRRALGRAIAELLDALEERGVYHPDTKPTNFLVRETDGEFKLWLVDLDRVRFGAPFTWTQWVKLLARLNAGLPAEVTVLDRLRCLRQTRWGERWGRLKLAREVYQLSVTRRPVWLRQE